MLAFIKEMTTVSPQGLEACLHKIVEQIKPNDKAGLDAALGVVMNFMRENGYVKTIERQESGEEVKDDVWIVAELANDMVEQSKYRRTCVPAGTKIYLKCNGMQGDSFYLETVEECVDHIDPQYMDAVWQTLHAAMLARETNTPFYITSRKQ